MAAPQSYWNLPTTTSTGSQRFTISSSGHPRNCTPWAATSWATLSNPGDREREANDNGLVNDYPLSQPIRRAHAPVGSSGHLVCSGKIACHWSSTNTSCLPLIFAGTVRATTRYKAMLQMVGIGQLILRKSLVPRTGFEPVISTLKGSCKLSVPSR